METASQPDPPRTAAASRWSIISPLIAAVLVMLTFVTISRPPSDLNVDTDTSLSAVLNYAHQHHVQFGTDLVCTYGPLGYLMFFYYSPHAAGMRLAVETVLCLTVALALCLVAWRLRLAWRCLLLGVFIFLAANVETRTDLVIDTGFLCCGLLCFVESGRTPTSPDSRKPGEPPATPSPALTGTLSPSDGEREGVRMLRNGPFAHCTPEPERKNIQHPTSNIQHPTAVRRPFIGCWMFDVGCWMFPRFMGKGASSSGAVMLILAAAAFTGLAAFGALAKASILFGAGLNLALLAGVMAARRQALVGAGMLAGFGAAVAVGWMVAGQDLSHLGSYLVNALAVVRGYNQALGWEALPSVAWAGLVVMLLAAAAVIIRAFHAYDAQQKHRTWLRGLLLAWLASLLFLSWKHGLARGDAYHVVYFFGFVPVLALALEVLPCESRVARLWARISGALACVLSILALQSYFFAPGVRSLQQPFRNLSYYARCLLRPAEYCQHMNQAILAKQNEARLPALRERIGHASADVFGDNAVYAIFNDLNYRPRPVFLSYLACTSPLIRLNEQFYLSPAAPEYVMFSLGGIDRRLAPLEDALVLRDLLINYVPVGGEGGFVLLKARSAEPARLSLLREGVVHPGERIDLRGFGSTNLWLEITLAPSVAGRLREFFYRPPPVRLAAWREPGKGLHTRRRAPAPMLAAGFVASPLLLRNEDVQDLYAGRPVSRPAAYSIELLPGQEHFWKLAVRFRVYGFQDFPVTVNR